MISFVKYVYFVVNSVKPRLITNSCDYDILSSKEGKKKKQKSQNKNDWK